MSRKYFGTDGIRGRVGHDKVTPEFVLKLGWAAGRVLGGGANKVVIGKDTRISGYMFEAALEAGLSAAGVDVLLTGPIPTPGIAYLTRTFHACAGIVISASHNPYFDNGIKFFSAQGDKLADEVELAIEAMIDQPMKTVDSKNLGKADRIDDAQGRYIEFCKSSISQNTTFQGLKIVVDCAHGATYQIAPKVLSELGAEVISIGVRPNGININENVGSTHPQQLQQRVIDEKADLGMALDGDGDRVFMVDHKGNLIDGDQILFIIARARKQQQQLRGHVVGTLMSNLGLELALNREGIELQRTDVGDRFVMERLVKNDWMLGGESSGHIICRNKTTTGDGTIAGIQVVTEIVRSGRSLHDLSLDMEKCPQQLINVSLGSNNAADIMQLTAVQEAVNDAEEELGTEGRVLLRPSGTEPLIRVMVEGVDAALVNRVSEQIANVVRDNLQV
ncbi:MAG TPA: phosphoglucosamine mutase [Gammaproteobacteria bacterium]|nr:phosphoglucosamine mutase [Gammaproteobacteria bacterium]